MAYYLAANGLNVLRFDHTNHVGESEGVVTGFTLPGGVEDILSALDYLERTHGVTKCILHASSLSARTAVRAAASDKRIAHLVCLVGVVNVRHTLREVYQEDLVGNHLLGKRWGITDILGVDIDFDQFLDTTVRSNMHDVAGTKNDIARIAASIALFPAEKDVWVLLDEVREVTRDRTNVTIHPIPNAMHEIRENPEAAEKAFREMIANCVEFGTGQKLPIELVVEPDKRQIMRQNKTERERLKKIAPPAETEPEFWAKYLEKYQMLDKVEDYRGYLETAGRLLGRIDDGETLLDAGCGNGMFGIWVVRDLMARQTVAWQRPPVYVGLDLTSEGLKEAMEKQLAMARKLTRPDAKRMPQMPGLMYGQVDLDAWTTNLDVVEEMVLFGDNCFDRICCSLVLSYLRRPGDLLRELHRVLRPDGRIVVSSMKPFCDMSTIYRDYMGQVVSQSELELGRNLLRAAGAIKTKEDQGIYTFYSGEELSAAVSAAGFRDVTWENSFGNQAVVVAARK